MKKALAGFVVIVAVGLVAGDLFLRSVAEQRMAAAMEAALDIPAEAEVTVDAFPFVLRTIQGRYPAVTVSADEVRRGAVRLTNVELTFTDIRFSLRSLLSGDGRRVALGAGSGEALLTERDLNRALRRNDIAARVDLASGGAVQVEALDGVSGSAEVSVAGSSLVVRPEGLPAFSLELPTFGRDMSYDAIEVRGSTARLGISVGETTVEF